MTTLEDIYHQLGTKTSSSARKKLFQELYTLLSSNKRLIYNTLSHNTIKWINVCKYIIQTLINEKSRHSKELWQVSYNIISLIEKEAPFLHRFVKDIIELCIYILQIYKHNGILPIISQFIELIIAKDEYVVYINDDQYAYLLQYYGCILNYKYKCPSIWNSYKRYHGKIINFKDIKYILNQSNIKNNKRTKKSLSLLYN